MVRRKVLLVGAVLAAVLGAALVFVYVQGADARAASKYDLVDVLTATDVIQSGETIESASQSGKLKLDHVPEGQLVDGYMTSIDTLSGQVALATIYPGEQIIAARFGSEAAAPSDLQIPKGKLAVSVNLTDPARVAGFVNPGSEVAIFLSGTDAESGKTFTRVLLDRVTVLGVGSTTPVSTTTTDETGQQTTEQLPRTLMTLAVDQKDAQRVLYASGNGELAFGLLTQDSTINPGPGVDADSLF